MPSAEADTGVSRIVLADRPSAARRGLYNAFHASADLAVIGAADTGRDALRLAYRHVPDEKIQIHPLEWEIAQKAYWLWPDNPTLLTPGDSVKIAFSEIRGYESRRKDTLYIAIAAERVYGEETEEGPKREFVSVGNVVRGPEALKKSSFRIEITDKDIPR